MKKIVSLLLILTLALCLMGCSGKAPEILGVYETWVDMRTMMVESFDAGTGVADQMSLDSYLGVCGFVLVSEFREDGSYSQYVDEASLQSCLDGLASAAIPFMQDFMVLAFQEQFAAMGVAVESVEDIEQTLGMSMDQVFEESMGMGMEEMIEEIIAESFDLEQIMAESKTAGKYKARDGKMHMSDSPETDYSDSVYETYTIEGDTVTVTGGVGVTEEEILPYPFTLVKVG